MRDDNEIRISKDVLDDLPEDYRETKLGDPRGARKQYRSNHGNVHVREHDDDFTIHVDREDPRRHPLRHLALDSPESLSALFCASLLSRSGEKFHEDPEETDVANSVMRFAFSFLLLNALFGSLKRLLRFFF
jgi:hypothetical protein